MSTQLDQYSFIDIHYHADPDLYKRRHSVIEAGKIYQRENGAVVLKSHLGATSIQATIAQKEGLPVFPSIVLNKIAGGIHYKPIIKALSEYQPIIPSKMIVHLPTITGRQHKSSLSREMTHLNLSDELCQPETIFDSHGKLKSNLKDIFKLARDYPIVLSSGHASKEETYALLEACLTFNISSLLLNQPANPLTGLEYNDLIQIVKDNDFAWIEQTALTYLLSYQEKSDFLNVLRDLPRVIYSSDLGQTNQIDIAEWLEISKKWFSELSLSHQRKEKICRTNPWQLLKI